MQRQKTITSLSVLNHYYCEAKDIMQAHIDDVCSSKDPEGYARYKTYRDKKVKRLSSDKVSSVRSHRLLSILSIQHICLLSNQTRFCIAKAKV